MAVRWVQCLVLRWAQFTCPCLAAVHTVLLPACTHSLPGIPFRAGLQLTGKLSLYLCVPPGSPAMGDMGFSACGSCCSSWVQSHRKPGKLHIHQLGVSCSLSSWRLPRDAFLRAWFWQGAWYPVQERRKLMNGGEEGKTK